MSIILSIIFTLFVLKFTFGMIRLGFRLTAGFVSLFTFFVAGAIILALFMAAVKLVWKLIPVLIIAGIVALVVYLVKKNREEQYYSYDDNI